MNRPARRPPYRRLVEMQRKFHYRDGAVEVGFIDPKLHRMGSRK